MTFFFLGTFTRYINGGFPGKFAICRNSKYRNNQLFIKNASFPGLWRHKFWKALWDPGLQRLLGIFQTQRATSTDLSMPSGNRNVHDRQGPQEPMPGLQVLKFCHYQLILQPIFAICLNFVEKTTKAGTGMCMIDKVHRN